MDMSTINFLRDLGLTWASITAAMSEQHRQTTLKVLKENPNITKQEFFKLTWIKQYEFDKRN